MRRCLEAREHQRSREQPVNVIEPDCQREFTSNNILILESFE
jgi:hypothetical protein